MPDIFLDVDVALAEVPVNIFPLTDDTDFKTRETAVTFDAAGMDLVWNFVTSAGAFTQTAVTPTTGGDYDWTHQGDGMYTIEIPASGGASINNDTEGYGWFSGVATGVLPWRGPVIGFRAAGINDALLDNPYTPGDGIAQGGSATTIQLSASESAVDDTYNGYVVRITAGTGIGQERVVTDYTGSTRTATVATWVTNPDSTSVYVLTAPANLGYISSDATAADNLEAAFDGTGGVTFDASFGSAGVDAIWAKAMSEPGSVPATTASVLAALQWLFVLSRNKITQNSSTQTLRNNADSVSIGTATVGDDGTTFTRDKWA